MLHCEEFILAFASKVIPECEKLKADPCVSRKAFAVWIGLCMADGKYTEEEKAYIKILKQMFVKDFNPECSIKSLLTPKTALLGLVHFDRFCQGRDNGGQNGPMDLSGIHGIQPQNVQKLAGVFISRHGRACGKLGGDLQSIVRKAPHTDMGIADIQGQDHDGSLVFLFHILRKEFTRATA